MDDYNRIRLYILFRLMRKGMWQHKHTSIHNLSKGLPDHLRSTKLVKEVTADLLKENFLLSKPTAYGLEISLNIKKKKEIEEFIKKVCRGFKT